MIVPVFIGRPTDEGEDTSGHETDDASMAVETLFVDDVPEADTVLDALFAPRQFDQRVVGWSARARRSAVMAATLGRSATR